MLTGRTAERRRLAAILIADVVGYSRLVAEYETRTLAEVRALRGQVLEPAFAVHGGRLFKAMGDAFFAEFPSAVEAVSCAVEVQRRLLAEGLGPTWPGAAHRRRAGRRRGGRRRRPARRWGQRRGAAARAGRAGRRLGLGRGAWPPRRAAGLAVRRPWRAGREEHPAPGAGLRPAGRGRRGPACTGFRRRRASADTLVLLHARRATLLVAAGLAALAVASGAGWWALAGWPRIAPASEGGGATAVLPQSSGPVSPTEAAARRSIVVLPFVNLGGGPDQDYLADGIAEDLTAALGRLSLILVIGHGTASGYKGHAVDVPRSGASWACATRWRAASGVSASSCELTSGSPRPGAAPSSGLRASTSRWATLPISPASSRCASPMHSTSASTRRRRSVSGRQPQDPNVMDLVLRARALFVRAALAREHGGDPTALRAGAGAQRGLVRRVGRSRLGARGHRRNFGWSQDPEADLQLAETHASHALALDPRNNDAHFAKGMVLSRRARFAEAQAEFDLIVADNPSNAVALAYRGLIKLRTDRPAEAIEDARDAMRISPRDWNFGEFHDRLAMGLLMLGRDEEALRHRLRARAVNPRADNHLFLLAAALQLVGRTEEARAALEEYRRLRWPPPSPAGGEGGRAAAVSLYLATRDRQLAAILAIGGMREE